MEKKGPFSILQENAILFIYLYIILYNKCKSSMTQSFSNTTHLKEPFYGQTRYSNPH